MRVMAAVSGGVDSAVALTRLVAAGHDVTAVHLALGVDSGWPVSDSRTCCSLDDAHDAQRVADVAGVPFYVWDVSAEFRSEVIDDFVAEYAVGRTPNPCLRCNERIKFSHVLERARALGFDAIATGHYARLEEREGGVRLRRAVDSAKDQSYVLAVLGAETLRRCLFPLGGTSKSAVRDEAARLGLLVARKPDSTDVCFIPDGDTAGFLRARLGVRPGPIVDADSGRQVGVHDGTYGFTVGQRRGLRLTEPDPSGHPRYVLRVDPASRVVEVGTRERLDAFGLVASSPVWCGPRPARGSRVLAQTRAHGRAVHAEVVQCSADSFSIRALEPLHAVAAGQSCVLYDGDVVLGQGTTTY
ncbi:MAG: tRNA 2-thiouridine(34) synthase MnmA [Candidatus Nanopelagicales bacterium]|nr:tRNA 2-thiouridine(34) synthase MnmA [Candidatus Nanopelagicales bacterium]